MSTPRPTPRTSRESLFMAAPLVFAVLLMLAIGVLVFLIWRGGVATGPQIHFVLEGTCAKEVKPLIDARMRVVYGDGFKGATLDGDKISIQTRLPDLPNIVDNHHNKLTIQTNNLMPAHHHDHQRYYLIH